MSPSSDCARDRERLLADSKRLLEAPREPQSAPEPREHLRALRRGRLRGDELDGTLLRGKARVVLPAFVQVTGEMRIQECSASAIVLADQLDRPPLKLDCSRCQPRAAGQLRGSGTELSELQLRELSRVRHDIPEHERPLEVRASL